MKNLFFLFFISQSLFLLSQNEYSVWYFGQNVGIDFNTSTPIEITDGATDDIFLGSSSICDSSGNLLFYTDAYNVWNREHEVTPNGTDLYGCQGGQTSLIVKKPGSETIFYLFTITYPSGLYYSILDLSLDGGLGDVSSKNNYLNADAKGITGILHNNCKDYWIITNKDNYGIDDEIQAYLLDASGLSTSPVVTTLPDSDYPNLGFGTYGFWRGSPIGGKLAYISSSQEALFIMDFDNTTGEASDIASRSYTSEAIFSCEFSASGNKLYMSASFDLSQFDVTLTTNDEIINSQDII